MNAATCPGSVPCASGPSASEPIVVNDRSSARDQLLDRYRRYLGRIDVEVIGCSRFNMRRVTIRSGGRLLTIPDIDAIGAAHFAQLVPVERWDQVIDRAVRKDQVIHAIAALSAENVVDDRELPSNRPAAPQRKTVRKLPGIGDSAS